MRKGTIVLCVLTVCLATTASADLIGWWRFDEGSGSTALDSSGKGNNGSLIGGPSWETEEGHGGILLLDGVDDHMVVEGAYVLPLYSAALWFRIDGGSGPRNLFGAYGAAGELYGASMQLESDGGLRYVHRFPFGSSGGTNIFTDSAYDDGVWYHGAIVKTPDTMTLYVNGEVVGTAPDSTQFDQTALTVVLSVLRHDNLQRFVTGAVDDFQLYDHALTAQEIQQAMTGIQRGQASAADPSDSTVDVLREVILDWTPGEYAQTHDVYLGTSFADVNDADRDNPGPALVSQGQIDTGYAPAERLDFGQTYYWRVDEVNGAPDNTVIKGEIWSFEVEPLSIPVTDITVTASSAHDADMIPERTIDGSGMDELDQHSSEPKHMWLSGMGDAAPSIQYEFDRAYKLHELWVWNSNQLIEGFVGLGAKDVTIEHSLNGTEWLSLGDTVQFAQAPGKAAHAHNTTIDLGGAVAKYVKLTVSAGYGMLPQYGLSELRFFYIPTNAREPLPADADTTDTVDVLLSWRAGREAATHEVYLGTDSTDLGLVRTVNETSAAVGPLDYATSYYWQIVEVNNTEDPSAYAGEIWSFSTPAYDVVDNFDQYDDDCNRIFFAWLDGLGHNGGEDVDNCNVASYNGNGSGSIVGNASSPFAEQTIVYAGTQSMPLEYDSGVSESTLALDAQDWTVNGIQSLSLQFYGAPDNTGQLYLKINNSKVSYNGLPGALQRAAWTAWNVDLAAIGAGLSNVTSLSLGIEGASAPGMIYVDEIRLYPLAPEFVTPTEPDPANLLAHYAFDGNANDSAGTQHGTLVGNAEFIPGQQGQALSLNTLTVTDYVEISGYQGILGASAITVAAWVKTDSDATGAIIGWGPGVAGQRFGFRIDAGRLRTEHHGGNIQGDTVMNDGSWHHVAVTVQANATVAYPQVQLWLDGQDDTRHTTDTDPPYDIQADLDVSIGRRPANDDRYFIGQIDELYIYNRALSQAEIAWLAGLSQPFDKPFAE
jgi:hypothetical protein